MAPYNPEILILDENSHVIEGGTTFPRTIVIKFESRNAAMAWYNSAAYQAVRPLRLAATEGFGVLVDGFISSHRGRGQETARVDVENETLI
jgi:uncharacterized protein (DUF1330 family)